MNTHLSDERTKLFLNQNFSGVDVFNPQISSLVQLRKNIRNADIHMWEAILMLRLGMTIDLSPSNVIKLAQRSYCRARYDRRKREIL